MTVSALPFSAVASGHPVRPRCAGCGCRRSAQLTLRARAACRGSLVRLGAAVVRLCGAPTAWPVARAASVPDADSLSHRRGRRSPTREQPSRSSAPGRSAVSATPRTWPPSSLSSASQRRRPTFSLHPSRRGPLSRSADTTRPSASLAAWPALGARARRAADPAGRSSARPGRRSSSGGGTSAGRFGPTAGARECRPGRRRLHDRLDRAAAAAALRAGGARQLRGDYLRPRGSLGSGGQRHWSSTTTKEAIDATSGEREERGGHPSIREYAERKLGKLSKVARRRDAGRGRALRAAQPVDRRLRVAEATIFTKGPTLRAREASPDMKASIDQLVDKLERQVKRYREMRRVEPRRHVPQLDDVSPDARLVGLFRRRQAAPRAAGRGGGLELEFDAAAAWRPGPRRG